MKEDKVVSFGLGGMQFESYTSKKSCQRWPPKL